MQRHTKEGQTATARVILTRMYEQLLHFYSFYMFEAKYIKAEEPFPPITSSGKDQQEKQ